jgi:hypothetical protein
MAFTWPSIESVIGSQWFWLFVTAVCVALALSGKLSMRAADTVLVSAWIAAIIGMWRSETISPLPLVPRFLVIALLASVIGLALYGLSAWWKPSSSGTSETVKTKGEATAPEQAKLTITDVEADIHKISIGTDPHDGTSSLFHLWITIATHGRSFFVRRWKLGVRGIPGKGELWFDPTHQASDGEVRYGDRIVVAPFNSQDLADRVDAITPDRPAVGILNFALKGISKEQLMTNKSIEFTVVFIDENGVSGQFQGPYRIKGPDTEPSHTPGFKETMLPPGSKGSTSADSGLVTKKQTDNLN